MSTPTWPTVRRALELVGLWSVPAVVSALQVRLFTASSPKPILLGQALFWQGLPWYAWTVLTPLIALVARAYPVARPAHGRRAASVYVVHAVSAVAAGAVFAAASVAADAAFGPVRPVTPPLAVVFARSVVAWLPTSLLTYLAVVGVVTALHHARRAGELRAALSRAQLHALRAQLRPHFFFNALNTVAALVRTGQGGRAVAALAQIGDLLRAMLETPPTDLVPLRDELALVRRYLEIEELRFQDRLRVTVDVDEPLLGASVPALILQPLVENAVRHGIGRLVAASEVRIAAAASNGELVLDVSDDGPGWAAPPTDGAGTGLANVRARLHALYGERAQVELLSRHPRGAQVRLRLPRESA